MESNSHQFESKIKNYSFPKITFNSTNLDHNLVIKKYEQLLKDALVITADFKDIVNGNLEMKLRKRQLLMFWLDLYIIPVY